MYMTSIFEDILGRPDWGARPALLGPDGCSYGDLLRATEDLARLFRSAGGERPIIGVCVPPSFGYAAALLAAAAADAVLVPLNPSASEDEKYNALENAGARALLTDQPQSKLSFTADKPEKAWRDLRFVSLNLAQNEEPRAGDRFLIYTSGSTTRPKAAILSDFAISSNIRAIVDNMALSPGDSSIVFTPTGYTYAMSQTLTHLWAGGATVQYPHGMMYPAEILKAIANHRLTGLACNPTFMRVFSGIRLSSPLDFSSVRYVKSAGQPLYSELARSMSRLFPNARILCTYGCTENSPRICHHWLPIDLPDRDAAWSVGWPLQGVEVKIADPSGTPVPSGSSGEIFIRGTSLMRGYWCEPQMTAERLIDGWFRSGDLGVIGSDGALEVLGRADNIVGVGHEKVAPEEVEAIISQVPGVQEVAVGGAADPLLDHVIVALIVVSNSADEVIGNIKSVCREKLAPAKQPRHFYCVESVPKTPYGKHDRKAIKAVIAQLAEPS